jgi:aspartate carbamoyltransferase regulatory subunit
MAEEKRGIRITPIKMGTAIDHLPAGSAFRLLQVLEIHNFPMTAAMNVDSGKMGKKDLIFIEGKELDRNEINKIALIGKGATLNIIKDEKIVKKEIIDYPSEVDGILKCINPKCITNVEGIAGKFKIIKEPLQAKCRYCETIMKKPEIIRGLR